MGTITEFGIQRRHNPMSYFVFLFLMILTNSSTILKADKPKWDTYETYLNSSYISKEWNSSVKKAYEIIVEDEFDRTTVSKKALEYFLIAIDKGCKSPQIYKDAMLCKIKSQFSRLDIEVINEFINRVNLSKDENTIKLLYDIVINYYSDDYPYNTIFYYNNLLKIINPADKSVYEKIGDFLLKYQNDIIGHLDYVAVKSIGLSLDGKSMLVGYENDFTLYKISPDECAFNSHNLLIEYHTVSSLENDREVYEQAYITSGIYSDEEKPIEERKRLKFMLLDNYLIKFDKLTRPLSDFEADLLMAASLGDYYYEHNKLTDLEKERLAIWQELVEHGNDIREGLENEYRSQYPEILASINDINFLKFPNDERYILKDINFEILTKNTDYRWKINDESALTPGGITALSAAISFDKKYKVYGFKDGRIQLIELSSNTVLREFKQPLDGVDAVNISFDNKYIVSAGWQGFYLFNAGNGELIKEFNEQNNYNKLVISKDNEFIFTGGNGGVGVYMTNRQETAKKYYRKAGLTEADIVVKLKD